MVLVRRRAPALFGPSTFGVLDSGPGGIPDREAGGHPYEFSTRIDFANVKRDTASGGEAFTSVQDVRDVAVDLPVGFVGSAVATPTCSLAELSAQNSCPTDTEVGHIRTEPEGSLTQINGPIYNVTPEVGLAAEFGYVDALKTAHVIVARVVPGPGRKRGRTRKLSRGTADTVVCNIGLGGSGLTLG